MKKIYVLAAATLLCAGANAAGVQMKSQVKAPAKVQVQTSKALIKHAVATEADHSVSHRVARKAAPVEGEAFYKRPAGSMFGALTSNSYLLYNPYVTVKPYATTTFVANPLDGYNWSVQLYNQSAGGREWLTGNTQNISVTYGYETDSVPSLSDGVTEYHMGGTNKDNTAGWSTIAGIPDMTEWTNDETSGFVLMSPKSFAKRLGDEYATVSYSGAKDAEGGSSGLWFGKNYSGWNAMGVYVEKPENPYLLRQVFVSYHNLELAKDGDIKVEVYKVASRVEEDTVAGIDVTLGDLIAEGTYTFVKADAPAESGVIAVPFKVTEGDFEFEITPTIDDEIFVVVSGYDSDSFTNFSMSCASNEWDEGYGQHGYMIHKDAESGDYTRVIGLDHFFNGATWASTSPTVFFDVLNPFMVYNYNIEEGVREFDKAGNCTTAAIEGSGLAANVLSIYSYTSSEEMEYTLEDGSDLPEWITIEAEDQMGDDNAFNGEVRLTVTAAANEGPAREANVRVAIPGAYLTLVVKQEGDGVAPVENPCDVNGDGTVDISDVNIAINVMLGKEENAKADVNGDGNVDISDVNLIINAMLGK